MASSILMTVCRYLVGPIYHRLFPCRVYGITNYYNLSTDQPIILVSNHPGHHDPLQLIVNTNRNLHFMAKKELFQGYFGWFFNSLGLIRIDRDQHGSGLTESANYLANGRAVAVFPEGTTKYKRPDQLLPFKYGAVRLARDNRVPIVPIAIIGQPKLFRSSHCSLRFGQAYMVDPNCDLTTASHQLETVILRLMKQTNCPQAKLLPGRPSTNPSKRPPLPTKRS